MTDQRGLTVQAVALKVLDDRVKARRAEVNHELLNVMMPGDRTSARLDSGVAVGAVTYTNGTSRARVVDEPALMRWVEANHPDDIIAQIRPSLLAHLLDVAQKSGAAVTAHGEALPGVQVYDAAGYLTVRPDSERIPELLQALRSNQELVLGTIPEVE